MKQSYPNNGFEAQIQIREYITLDEALKTTGLSEKTLKDHMRGSVPAIGKNSWDRNEFFDYWKKLFDEKRTEKRAKNARVEEILDNLI